MKRISKAAILIMFIAFCSLAITYAVTSNAATNELTNNVIFNVDYRTGNLEDTTISPAIRNKTHNGTLTSVDGISCLQNSPEYIRFDYNGTIKRLDSVYTIETYVYLNAVSQNHIVELFSNGDDNYAKLSWDGALSRFVLRGSGTRGPLLVTETNDRILETGWYHVVATSSAAGTNIYVNGVKTGTSTQQIYAEILYILVIGAKMNPNLYIAYATLYNVAATDAQVAQMYAAIPKVVTAEPTTAPTEAPNTDTLYGDVNGDGNVNTLDATFLSRYLANWTGYSLGQNINFANSDLNKDGNINPMDFTIFGRYLSGWEAFRTLPYGVNVYSEINGTYGGTDDLGRTLSLSDDAGEYREDRYVGIFYFLLHGQHGMDSVHDNYKIVSNTPSAVKSGSNWISAGGGAVGEHHFWAEPLFGYYVANDEWVRRKHIQMLTDAGVDFLVFDTTNAFTYDTQALQLLSLLDEYYKKGWDVPKIVYYTNSASGVTMEHIYNYIYKAHPEYQHLWFNWDGKPLIIGAESEASLEVKAFYRIKSNQWPNETKKDDAFPWMEFSRALTTDAIYGLNGKKEVMSVSAAQHGNTLQFSLSAWYGAVEKSRSWHDGGLDVSSDAIMWGYNFAEQFEYAIEQDPEIIFITGWNEWIAQRQATINDTISFVDCADPENSRDIEPMNGLFGDNYYMQMINYIRQYKGVKANVDQGVSKTIDMTGSFDQWTGVSSVYKDYTGEAVDRNALGYGYISYTNTTGRNDIDTMKVCRDSQNVYFYVNTKANITDLSGMSLFLSITGSSEDAWEGYNFVINRTAPVDGEFIVEKCTGGWGWSEVARVKYTLQGNQLMISIPRTVLGIFSTPSISLQFKWADNCNVLGDVFKFYTDGDVAPYGRMNYVYTK